MYQKYKNHNPVSHCLNSSNIFLVEINPTTEEAREEETTMAAIGKLNYN